ncbi:hypothetical protein UY3_06174 [Chelonia mydas]|uniref:Uncharacterized protein n=1 Tax=Chelonia mydas TaxID=8469 RepID=M7BFA0_CHEMY|nr:hypothetical protein UY3_06174 [Chelonia mydas]
MVRCSRPRGAAGSGGQYVPRPAPLPAAPIGLERQTTASGSCDQPNLRTLQLSYIAGVFGIAFQWFHSDVENGAVGGNGQRSGDYVLLFLTEMGFSGGTSRQRERSELELERELSEDQPDSEQGFDTGSLTSQIVFEKNADETDWQFSVIFGAKIISLNRQIHEKYFHWDGF